MTEDDVQQLSLQQREEIVFIAIQRTRANLLCFSHLCPKAACRRADTCSADPDICMGHIAPFVPDIVRQGVNALLEGQFDRLTYDEVRSQNPPLVQAYEGWIATILESKQGATPAGRPKSRRIRHDSDDPRPERN